MTKKEKEFTELCNKHYITLRNIMRKMVSDTYIAEDIAQETFIKIWKKKMWREEGFFSLMVTIGKNLCYDHFRRVKSRRNREEYLSTIHKPDYVETSPERLFFLENISESISDVLENKVSERRRSVFKKHVINYISSGDIAKSLSLSKRTVENHIYSTRDTLKKIKEVKDIFNKKKKFILNKGAEAQKS